MTRRLFTFLPLALLLSAVSSLASAQTMQSLPKAMPMSGNSTGLYRTADYYEDHASVSASGFINQYVVFSKIPSTIRVQLSTIACATTSANTPLFMFMGMNNESVFRRINLPIAPYTYAKVVFGDKYVYYTNNNASLNVILNPGTSPYVNFYTNGPNPFTITLDCTLIGKPIPLR